MVSNTEIRRRTKLLALKVVEQQQTILKKHLCAIMSEHNNWKMSTNLELLKELEALEKIFFKGDKIEVVK